MTCRMSLVFNNHHTRAVVIRVGIALGSNLGNRQANIQTARDLLCELAAENGTCIQAPLYGSEPMNCPEGSPDFLNTVIEIPYSGQPDELLSQTQKIEASLGRESVYPKNAPRVIDIDILYFGENIFNDERLSLPHPELTRRRFVLKPLAMICPDLILPGDDKTITEHLHQLDSNEAELTLVESEW